MKCRGRSTRRPPRPVARPASRRICAAAAISCITAWSARNCGDRRDRRAGRLMAHGIGLPPILNLGSEEMKRGSAGGFVRRRARRLAISEAEGGSDVASPQARRHGDHFVVDGQSISTVCAAITTRRRAHRRRGHGHSLLLIERDRAGFTQTELPKGGPRHGGPASMAWVPVN